jgi:putative FmdB family regulatory protein
VPIYEYRCNNGHTFEVIQRMSDEAIAVCQVCSAPVERVFHPVAVHFKGSGFYTTDYGAKAKAASDGGEGKPAKSDAKSSDSKGSGQGEKAKTPAGDGD